jgi:hypothetical protein
MEEYTPRITLRNWYDLDRMNENIHGNQNTLDSPAV